MEASSIPRIGGKTPRDIFSSRRGTITVAVAAAVLAGLLIYMFVQRYRSSVSSSATNTPVFVARGYIPRGTAASVVGSEQLMQRSVVKTTAVQRGAITDPTVLHGQVTTTDIYPGQQLTAADFSATGVTIASQLRGADRAIAIPVDSSHGMTGFVQAGNRVDVLASFSGTGNGQGAVNVVAQNVLVLSAPGAGSGGGLAASSSSSANIVLRVNTPLAQELAFDADNGKVWVVLRPPVGAVSANGSGT
jgi:Flp pilus assembly protein CpaB